MKSAEENRSIMGLRRGLEVIEFLARHPDGCTFGALREGLDGLAATTVSRVVKVLLETGWIHRNDGDRLYRLDMRSHQLARAIGGQLSREDILMPILSRLAGRRMKPPRTSRTAAKARC